LVTETTLDPSLPPEKLDLFLRTRKTTGQLTYHYTQGGKQRIVLVERTKASEPQKEKIRDILGFK
jgi:hypothetical protein